MKIGDGGVEQKWLRVRNIPAKNLEFRAREILNGRMDNPGPPSSSVKR